MLLKWITARKSLVWAKFAEEEKLEEIVFTHKPIELL